jgi:hypothetical protein
VIETHGMALPQALAILRQYLPRTAVLVGQNIAKDVQWLGLRDGEDFAQMMDLAGLFRIHNPQYDRWTVFGQDHLAKVLLNWDVSGSHDAVGDAIKSVRLFNLHQRARPDAARWAALEAALLASKPEASFAKRNPTFEGVCMGGFRTCTCGAPFLG